MRTFYRLLFALVLAAFANFNLQAQCTLDTTMTGTGIYPATLIDGCEGQFYSETVQVAFPLDTLVSGFLVPVDSVRVLSITLPPGLSYTCNVGGCVWTPSNTASNATHFFGCITISGTPTAPFNPTIDVNLELCGNLLGSSTCLTHTETLNLNIGAAPVAGFVHAINSSLVSFGDTSVSQTGVLTWDWDFGDGNSSTLQNPTNTYGAGGTYTVCLVVTDSCGSDTACDFVSIGCFAPAASFNATITGLDFVGVDQSVSTSGGVTSWLWDFGDGNTSTAPNATHTYSVNGNFQVCLTITDSCGPDSHCQLISVQCSDPIAAFQDAISGNWEVAFVDISTGSVITSWAWDFGDGITSTVQHPVHQYPILNASYTVCLIVADSCGVDTGCQQVLAIGQSINEEILAAEITVMPNPSGGIFTVEIEQERAENLTGEVVDLSGRVVFEYTFKKQTSLRKQVDLTGLSSGIYYLRITDGIRSQTKKIVLR
jgi:PKD repeat protein